MAEEKTLNPAAMPIDDAAEMIGIVPEWIADDIAAGAPKNPDGSINLVHYVAWLNLKLRGTRSPRGEESS